MLNTVCFKYIVGITVALGILFQPALSYAWTGHRDHRYPYQDRREFGMMIDLVPHNSRLIMVGGSRYYYDGAYYAPASNGYILVAPPVGAMAPLKSLPPVPVMVSVLTDDAPPVFSTVPAPARRLLKLDTSSSKAPSAAIVTRLCELSEPAPVSRSVPSLIVVPPV